MKRSKHLLFVSPFLAMPSQHGGCVYPHALLEQLYHQGWTIDYAWLGTPLAEGRMLRRNPLKAAYLNKAFIRGCYSLGPLLLSERILGRRSQARPHGECMPSQEEARFFRTVLRRSGARHVLLDTTIALPLLDILPPQERAVLRCAVLTHNVLHRRSQLYREHGISPDFLTMDETEEKGLLKRADVIIAIQEREAREFQRLCPERRVRTVPMPAKPKKLPPAPSSPPTCLFVGGYSGHNIAGLKWLLEAVWPSIQKAMPEARLLVAGTVGKALSAVPLGVEILGPVADLSATYGRTQVALVPLTLGTGLKIKLIEAFAHERAVVTTEAGAEGYDALENGSAVSVAADASDFAQKTLDLLRSQAARETQVHSQSNWLNAVCDPERVGTNLENVFLDSP